jgi:16S rRNA (cytosine1402-N4)-methyltransferase
MNEITAPLHQPVMLKEVIENLNINPEGIYIDATFGRGGHANAILNLLGPRGKLIVLDKDPAAIKVAQQMQAQDIRIIPYHSSYKHLGMICETKDLLGKVDGILFDLGVSSPQLDDAERGFSFMKDGPLDMRMNLEQKETAASWLNSASQVDIAYALKNYGDERFAKKIATEIVNERVKNKFTTTKQLSDFICQVIPRTDKFKHPATRCFQAIRIQINEEMKDLTLVLAQVLSVLRVGGRLCVISFHSTEDRMVKQFIAQYAKGDFFPRGFPIKKSQLNPQVKPLGKAIKPSDQEVEGNVRSRSAVMRVAEKISEGA